MAATDTLQAEYEALTEGCGLVDRSERGKLALTGAGAVEFLNGQVTNELTDLHPGEGRYAAFLTNKGKMLGDLRILAVGAGVTDATSGGDADSSNPPSELLLDTERVALQALFDMIRRYKLGYEVELHKRTLERGLLSLIGPVARACIERLVGAEKNTFHTAGHPPSAAPGSDSLPHSSSQLPQDEHAHTLAQIAGTSARLIATVEGIDVLCEATDLETVRGALVDGGASPVSEAAAEIVRVERGRPRYGVDMDESTIPQEAGLNERAVSFTKGCYVGQETVARLYYRGKPNRHLRGLRFLGTPTHLPPVPGEELRLGDRPVGHPSSVVESPRLGTIALALVRREASPGDTLAVGELGATAELVELPF
jgi:tRNA-modifying protein YgfZ